MKTCIFFSLAVVFFKRIFLVARGDLSGIEELFEAAQKLDALIVARLGIDEDQQWRAALRTHHVPRLVRS